MTYRETGEGQTADGRHVSFAVDTDKGGKEAGLQALAVLESLRFPETHHVSNVEHGGYGRYSRYEINQHDYAGGNNEVGGGFYEVLEIADPPDDRAPIVSHGYLFTGSRVHSFFVEWESVEAAKADMQESEWKKLHTQGHFTGEEGLPPGATRLVECGYLTPWFYAVGNQHLVGDYTFPEHLAQDPVYQFGRKFVVPEDRTWLRRDETRLTMKTCMGVARLDDPKRGRYGYEEGREIRRIAQWHDGTTTVIHDTGSSEALPRPAEPGELWVADAQREFDEVIAGGKKRFEIEFPDGDKFIGRYVEGKTGPKETPAGRYVLEVTFSDGSEPKTGYVDFEPDDEFASVGEKTHSRLTANGQAVEKIVVRNPDHNGQPGKRLGTFYHRG